MSDFINKDGVRVERTKCYIYSRVSGFITPVSNYNIGKKSEFFSRKFYAENISLKSNVISSRGCGGCDDEDNLV